MIKFRPTPDKFKKLSVKFSGGQNKKMSGKARTDGSPRSVLTPLEF